MVCIKDNTHQVIQNRLPGNRELVSDGNWQVSGIHRQIKLPATGIYWQWESTSDRNRLFTGICNKMS